MRLWSLSPKYLDVKGLLAVWREGLLARAVLNGQTRGYLHHPQLDRFKTQADPLAAIDYYLEAVLTEADRRGYHFGREKIVCGLHPKRIEVTEGQLRYEMAHLHRKLEVRDPARLALLSENKLVELHPLFVLIHGAIEPWEKGSR
jgi:hypothetical protein